MYIERMAKSKEVAELLERRIVHGDYLLKELPGEEALAQEVCISRMTARRAMLQLMEKGLVRRQQNGRLTVNRTGARRVRQIAFLRPAFVGAGSAPLNAAVRLLDPARGRIRPVEFVHWDDPTLVETLQVFDGVLLVPPAETIPQAVLALLKDSHKPVVVLDRDLSAQGIHSVDTCPVSFAQQVLDHLKSLGHQRIDCLNSQPRDEIIAARIQQWALWKAAHQVEGELIDDPVESYGDATTQAYQTIKSRLRNQGIGSMGSAILATTVGGAIGAMRALHEQGVRIGRQLAVASVSVEGVTRYAIPSITGLHPPEPDAFIKICLDWILSGGRREDWPGSLLLKPTEVPMLIGESTVPGFDHSRI